MSGIHAEDSQTASKVDVDQPIFGRPIARALN
jgi:hypothetical protein